MDMLNENITLLLVDGAYLTAGIYFFLILNISLIEDNFSSIILVKFAETAPCFALFEVCWSSLVKLAPPTCLKNTAVLPLLLPKAFIVLYF